MTPKQEKLNRKVHFLIFRSRSLFAVLDVCERRRRCALHEYKISSGLLRAESGGGRGGATKFMAVCMAEKARVLHSLWQPVNHS
jgi:hypothetical protein